MKKYLILLLLTSMVGLSSCMKEPADPFAEANAQLVKDEEIIKNFIADNNIPALRHESGLYYQILKPGVGTVVFNANTRVTVNYNGKFLSGTGFDQSTQPVTFPLGGVIVGWQIGVPLIQKGGKIRLIIPSGYAYGVRGSGSVPANSILDFDIELIEVQ